MSLADGPKRAVDAPEDEASLHRSGLDLGRTNSPSDRAVLPGGPFKGSLETVAPGRGMSGDAVRAPFAELSHALDELELRLREGRGCGDDPRLKSALTALGTQLRAFARRKTQASEEAPLAGGKSTAPQATFPFKSDLLSRLNPPAPTEPGLDQGLAAGDASILIDMQNDIAELARKLDNMCQGVAHPLARKSETVRDGDIGRAGIAAISGASGHAPPQSAIEHLETAIDDMTAHFEAPRADAPSLEPPDRLARDFPFSIGGIDQFSTLERLEREIKAIGGRLETLGKPEIDPAAFARMQRQTEEIRASLTALAARPPAIDKLERQIAMLAESQAKGLAIQGPARPAESDGLGAAASEILRLLKDPARIEVLQGIEARLDALAATAKTNESGQHDALSRHIEMMHRRLTARFEAGLAAASAETATLKDLVGALAEKIEATRDPKATDVAIEALERELAKVVQRLDGADKGFASLTSIEQTMSALFEQVEEIRRTALEAAQAARNAVRNGAAGETRTTEAAGQRGAELDHEPSLTREIADLRTLQEAADRRTHLTLTAVQETVGKVADRLARLESELGEMRPGQLGPLLSPGLSPIFAPRLESANKNAADERRDSDAEGAIAKAIGRLGEKSPFARGSEGAGAVEPTDYLIEPGSGFPRPRGAGESRGPGASAVVPFGLEERADRADFIAAARRAAQAAQKDALDAIQAIQAIHAGADRAASGAERDIGVLRQTRRFYRAHKRPLILSLAALCLAVGVYALARTMAHGNVREFSPAFLKQLGKGLVRGDATPPPQSDQLAGDLQGAPAPVRPEAKREAAPSLQNSSKSPPPQGLFAPSSGYAPSAPETLATKSISGSAPILIGALVDALGHSDSRPSAPAPLFWTGLPAASLSAAASEDPRGQGEAGNAAAQFALGIRYAEGRDSPRDLKLAAQWYEKAARQGLATAQYRLARLYEKGLGVAHDTARAASLYRAAAEQGNTRAMHNLGVLAAEGADGRPDYATAALWFGKAAEFGVRDSQFNVAVLLARGLGAPQNLVQAYAWFAILAAGGDAEAGRKRDEAGARLTATELAAAKMAAETFRPRQADLAANEISSSPADPGVAPTGQIPDATKAKVSGL